MTTGFKDKTVKVPLEKSLSIPLQPAPTADTAHVHPQTTRYHAPHYRLALPLAHRSSWSWLCLWHVGVGENTVADRRVRHAGFADYGFLDGVSALVSRRLRPTAFHVLHDLHSAGDAVHFDPRTGKFLTGNGAQVHQRTIDALTANRLLVRDPANEDPTYRVSQRGATVLDAIDRLIGAPLANTSQQQRDVSEAQGVSSDTHDTNGQR